MGSIIVEAVVEMPLSITCTEKVPNQPFLSPTENVRIREEALEGIVTVTGLEVEIMLFFSNARVPESSMEIIGAKIPSSTKCTSIV